MVRKTKNLRSLNPRLFMARESWSPSQLSTTSNSFVIPP
jgi:hypothetical protein